MAVVEHVWQMILALVVCAGPIPLSVLFVHDRDIQERSVLEAALVVTVAWCAVQMAVGTILGVLGWLSLVPVLGAEILLLAAGFVQLRRRRARPWSRFTDTVNRLRPGGVQLALIACLSWLGLVMAWRLLTQPTANFDSLYYHLPHIAWWIQHGDLTLHEAFYPVHRYPFGWELLCTLLVLPLREDLLVSVPNLVAWVLLGLAVARSSRLLGASRTAALVAAGAVLATPETLSRLDAVQVDVALAAFFLAGLTLGMSWLRRPTPRTLFMAVVCVGLMLAVKLTGLVYLLLLSIILAGLFVIGGREFMARRCDTGACLRPLLLGLAAAALLAGFWYLRNAIDLGNPLGYFELRVGGVVLFPGPLEAARLRASSLARIASAEGAFDWGFYLRLLNTRFGPALFVLLASACLWPLALKRRSRHDGLTLLLLSVLLVGGSFLAYWTSPASAGIGQSVMSLTPWTANSLRFAFPCLASLAILAAVTWSRLPWLSVALTPLLILSAMVAAADLSAVWPMVGAAGVTALALAPVLRVRARNRSHSTWATSGGWIVATASIVSVVLLSHTARATRNERRVEVYGEGYRFLSEELDPAETLGWISSTRSYMFYGRNLDRRVTYVARRSDELDAWLDLLRERKVSIVAMGPFTRRQEGWKGMRERRWMATETSRFIRLAGRSFPRDVFYYRFADKSPAAPDSTRTDRPSRQPR